MSERKKLESLADVQAYMEGFVKRDWLKIPENEWYELWDAVSEWCDHASESNVLMMNQTTEIEAVFMMIDALNQKNRRGYYDPAKRKDYEEIEA